MKRHIAPAAVTAAALAALSGCQTRPPEQDLRHAANPAPLVEPPPATQPTSAPNEANVGSAEVLALKTQNYTREMETLITQRAKAKGEPSFVEFLDPDQFNIGLTPASSSRKPEPPVTVVPISHPVIESTPSIPNQGATLATAEKTPSASGANIPRVVADSPLDKSAPAISKDSSAPFELTISQNVGDHPRDLWAQLDYQLLQFLKDKPTPQLDVLSKLSAEDRELITAVMDALSNFRNNARADKNMLMSRKVRPLLDMADRVRAQADLLIPTMALCTRVNGFGNYEPVEPARFIAMKVNPIIVYCEVENFASQLNEKKMWETRLSQEIVLYTETGLPVWQDKTQNIPDLARSRRHDFFVVKKTQFPANVTIGRYLLKVTIVDQQANRVAESTLPVQFVAE